MPSVETGCTLPRTAPRRREARQGQFETPIHEKMPAAYEVRQYLPADAVSADSKATVSLLSALQIEASKYRDSTLTSFFCSAFIRKIEQATIFFTDRRCRLSPRRPGLAEHFSLRKYEKRRARTEGFFRKVRCCCTSIGSEQRSL